MITRLLVANRGEIARRVMHTCRRLGIETVAVFSDADAGMPHVAEADHAVRLPGARPGETYLDVDRIVEAARLSGADAVHPGYGFLSENAGFARAVIAAGRTWIGPPPEAVAAMGVKDTAKRLMADAGVPVLPSYVLGEDLDGELGEDLHGDAVADAAPGGERVTEMTFPLLVKAAAGGGGRGMRIVRDPGELPGAVRSAAREAAAAFGDGTVFGEPLLEHARHIEVQILADAHGTVWALGERECSVQRRHQKVIEETPSPGVDAALRARLQEAAVRAARAIGYVGAGTVEFLVSRAGTAQETVAFLEMNTRLQVEHPVTECVHGVDLVALQLEVAEGARLPEEPPEPRGHAVEVRLYAEDPAQDWRPQSGTLHLFEVPGVDTAFDLPRGLHHGSCRGPAVGLAGRAAGDDRAPETFLRLDSGVQSGCEIGVHYDPMLAKIIAFGPTRRAAVRRLATALAGSRIHGPGTNRDLLLNVLRHPAFLAGETDTGFLERHRCGEPPAAEPAVRLSALAAALAAAAGRRAAATVQAGLPSGWRNVVSQPQLAAFEGPAGPIEIAYRLAREGLSAPGFDDVAPGGVVLVQAAPGEVVLEAGGVRRRFTVARYGDTVHVDSPLGAVRLAVVDRLPEPVRQVAPGSLLAPMPGTVLRVDAGPGDPVEAGQSVVVLEAMKMEHRITAPAPGKVAAVHVEPGTQVEAGAVLAVIEEQH